jgi:hypothetical protein
MLGVEVTVVDLGAFLLWLRHNPILGCRTIAYRTYRTRSLPLPPLFDPRNLLSQHPLSCFRSKNTFSVCLADIVVLRTLVQLQFFAMLPQQGELQSYLHILNPNIFPSTFFPRHLNLPPLIAVSNHGSQSYKTNDTTKAHVVSRLFPSSSS